MKSKLESQVNFLQSIQWPEVQAAIDGLSLWLGKIENAKDKRDLLTMESRAGHLYFRNYAKLFDAKYQFISRHGGGIRLGNHIIKAVLDSGQTIAATVNFTK